MRIVFVDNLLVHQEKFLEELVPEPHLGLMSLVGVARSAGHTAFICDPKWLITEGKLNMGSSFYERMARTIQDYSPDVVGFTSLGCNFVSVVKVAAYLKKRNPSLPILVGGPHATILHREVIESLPQFDVVVRHEAELTLAPLLDALPDRNFGNLPGITYRSANGVVVNADAPLIEDLDRLPMAAYDSYPLAQMGIEKMLVEAGRGCPFECTFCSTAEFFKRKYRLKSAKRLCAELDWLHDNFGFTGFRLTHDLFTVVREKVLAFCDEVKDRGYEWSCSARMDCVDAEMVKRMREAGCYSIYYGVETGSPRMQKIIQKRLDLSLVDPTLEFTIGAQVRPTTSFITGYPAEEISDQLQTLDVATKCLYAADGVTEPILQLHLLAPEPGTLLSKEFSGRLLYDGHISDMNLRHMEENDDEFIRNNPTLLMTYHFFPTVLPRDRFVFVTTAFRLIIVLGNSMVRYLLLSFGRSLGTLLDRMYAWKKEHWGARPLDESFVLEFLSEALGAKHHTVSLVKYTYACLSIIRQKTVPAKHDAAEAWAGARYIANPYARIVRNIHDCRPLLEAMRGACASGAAIPDDGAGEERGDYLIVAREACQGQMENFRISPEVMVVLAIFSRELSLREGATMYEQMTSFPLSEETLRQLIDIRAIVAAETRAASQPDANAVQASAGVPAPPPQPIPAWYPNGVPVGTKSFVQIEPAGPAA